jgi:hypothetical protein
MVESRIDGIDSKISGKRKGWDEKRDFASMEATANQLGYILAHAAEPDSSPVTPPTPDGNGNLRLS